LNLALSHGAKAAGGTRPPLEAEGFEAGEDLRVARRDEASVLDEGARPGQRELVRRIGNGDHRQAAREAQRERPKDARGGRGKQPDGRRIRISGVVIAYANVWFQELRVRCGRRPLVGFGA
jgi:hypothetical protein